LIFISTAIFGIFFGPIFPLYGACVRDYFEERVTGIVIGAWKFLYGIGAVLAPLVAGLLSDLTGTLRWGFAIDGVTSLTFSILPKMLCGSTVSIEDFVMKLDARDKNDLHLPTTS
jgi:MFS family permease